MRGTDMYIHMKVRNECKFELEYLAERELDAVGR
jgi:hypothetical protein